MLIDVTLPQLGESVNEGTISKWLVREGDVVKKDQALVSIATDKADSELPAPAAGRVTKLLAAEGQIVPVKTVIAQIEEGASASLSAAPGPPVSLPPAAVAQAVVAAPAANPRSALGALATPVVRKVALEHDVDLAAVQGTGERGRVTRDDVLRAASSGTDVR
ncbi:MAG: biotin/lipoyl-containing protein, partial [Polyangiaceae bacterium]